MKTRARILWLVTGLALAIGAALAGNGTITVLDSGSVARTYSVVTDGSGNFVGRSVICDFTAAANCAAVSAANAVSNNLTQLGGNTILTGNGVTGTGSPRVTISSDNTAFTVNAAQSGTWTVQPGNTPNSTPWLATVAQGGNSALVITGAPAAGTAGLLVKISPDGVNANGSATSANSAPVVIASDQAAVGIKGGAANNATAAGNPVPMSCLATSAEATVATNGQNSECATDLAHKLLVLPYANPENFVSGVTGAMTATTSTSLIAAPAAGLRNYITTLTCANSHATVGTFVLVQDGSGGTTIYEIPAAAVFGGASITFPTPLRQPTTATAIFVQDVTTGANVICAAAGYKGS